MYMYVHPVPGYAVAQMVGDSSPDAECCHGDRCVLHSSAGASFQHS